MSKGNKTYEYRIGPYASSVESAIQLWNAPHDKSLKMDRLVREARVGFNVEVTGAERLHRAASSERSERGQPQG